MNTRGERVQCYLALFFTIGEFCAGVYLLFYEGHILALYLAVTYAMRETTGGKHYHNVVFDWVHKVHLDKRFNKMLRNGKQPTTEQKQKLATELKHEADNGGGPMMSATAMQELTGEGPIEDEIREELAAGGGPVVDALKGTGLEAG